MKKRTSLCAGAQTAVLASVQIALWAAVGSAMRSMQHEVARITFWITAGKVSRPKWRQTMIDGNVLLLLELCALAVLVGVGVWRIYRTRQSATIDAPASVAYDMRQDGQRLSV